MPVSCNPAAFLIILSRQLTTQQQGASWHRLRSRTTVPGTEPLPECGGTSAFEDSSSARPGCLPDVEFRQLHCRFPIVGGGHAAAGSSRCLDYYGGATCCAGTAGREAGNWIPQRHISRRISS